MLYRLFWLIAEFTIPLLAIFALKEIFEQPEILKLKENRGGVIVSVLTAGVALILAVAPSVSFLVCNGAGDGGFATKAFRRNTLRRL